ncbi:hypothetical protein ACFLZ9_02465 [Patescibacteria group bacterium]
MKTRQGACPMELGTFTNLRNARGVFDPVLESDCRVPWDHKELELTAIGLSSKIAWGLTEDDVVDGDAYKRNRMRKEIDRYIAPEDLPVDICGNSIENNWDTSELRICEAIDSGGIVYVEVDEDSKEDDSEEDKEQNEKEEDDQDQVVEEEENPEDRVIIEETEPEVISVITAPELEALPTKMSGMRIARLSVGWECRKYLHYIDSRGRRGRDKYKEVRKQRTFF